MSNSREGSPDWLRAFQAPSTNVLDLSSDSSPENSPSRPSSLTLKSELERENETGASIEIENGEDSPKIEAQKHNSPKNATNPVSLEEEEPIEEDLKEKSECHSVSQRLPLVFPEKVQRTKALVECDGDSIDLSGDMGAVGRLIVSNNNNNNNGKDELLLDLKGTIYKSTIVPSRTFCIVSVGQSEAKIEAIMNDFIQLEPKSNLFEAETMVEGTLEGFSFDSDEEGERVPDSSNQIDKNNENGDQTNAKKTKRKAEKQLGGGQKKTKNTAKPQKRAPRKNQATKRTKKSKK